MDEKTPRAALPSVRHSANNCSRRNFLIAGLVAAAVGLLKRPAAAALLQSADEELIIVNGWIMKRSDLQD